MARSTFPTVSENHVRVVRQAKIVGGNIAEPNEFPYQVHLKYNDNLLCGGTILNTLFILTAAHCVKYKIPSRLRVTAGDHHRHYFEGPEQVRNVSHVFMHENYNWDTDINDIAILVLSKPLEFNEFVGSISYPKVKTEFEGMATVTGWGKETETAPASAASNILQKTKVPIFEKSECRTRYRRMRMTITDSMLCAGATGKDACQGDSGGPLTCRMKGTDEPVVCGVVSHGLGCGRPGFPGVYTDVSHYSQWIEAIMEKYMMRGKCQTGDFYCPEDKSCIPRRHVCDEKKECSNGSDELACRSHTVSARSDFRCSNGMSILSTWVCDNFDDCGDHSDEDKCIFRGNAKCTAKDHFVCKSDGRCIEKSWKCDKMVDCDDESDETDCNARNQTFVSPTSTTLSPLVPRNSSCRPNYFECSRICLPIKWKCDGDFDCPNGEDESNCPGPNAPLRTTAASFLVRTTSTKATTSTTVRSISYTQAPTSPTPGSIKLTDPPLNCGDDKFHCPGIHRRFCIPKSFKCDGDIDCVNGEDEDGCTYVENSANATWISLAKPNSTTTTTTRRPTILKECGKNQFKCLRSGNCITEMFVCDLDKDCEDGSDEASCITSTCSSLHWRCKNGDCIYHRYRCDNDVDCSDGSDEEQCSSGSILLGLILNS